MDSYIYKKDYSGIFEKELLADSEIPPADSKISDACEIYEKRWNKLPITINEKKKKVFEHLLPKLDNYVKSFGGSIEAIADGYLGISMITLTLPFLPCNKPEHVELFTDILQNTDGWFIRKGEEDIIYMDIELNYFERTLPPDWESIKEIKERLEKESE